MMLMDQRLSQMNDKGFHDKFEKALAESGLEFAPDDEDAVIFTELAAAVHEASEGPDEVGPRYRNEYKAWSTEFLASTGLLDERSRLLHGGEARTLDTIGRNMSLVEVSRDGISDVAIAHWMDAPLGPERFGIELPLDGVHAK